MKEIYVLTQSHWAHVLKEREIYGDLSVAEGLAKERNDVLLAEATEKLKEDGCAVWEKWIVVTKKVN